MTDAAGSKTVVAWLDPDQVELVRSAIDRAGVQLVGAGCPQLGRSSAVAEALGVQPLEDLRAALAASDADLILLAAPGDFGAGVGSTGGAAAAGGDELALLADRRVRGGTVIALEPIPASALQLSSAASIIGSLNSVGDLGSAQDRSAGIIRGGGVALARSLEFALLIPLMRRSPVMRAAGDVLEHLGPVHTASAEFLAGPGQGSLGARLFDAIDAITSLLGDAETVDAMYVWPGRGKIVHPVVGESLRGLTGVMTANMRFPDGRAASVICGDGSIGCGRWSRRLLILGERGRLTITDHGFEFISSDGHTVDRSEHRPATFEQIVGEQVAAAVDPRAPALPPTDWTRVLATAGAALLSARTGEVESPETILRMTMAG